MTRVLVAMSGGVDSSVAAALLLDAGHEVVGATMKLWGGAGDRGCCSVSDVEDARRVAQQLGIVHHVFNFSADFDTHVVDHYVSSHAGGRTPNPCIECNRHLKFDRFLHRAVQLGFDAVATGHHARAVRDVVSGGWRLRRGADRAKDQSYVLHMLDQSALARTLLPVGDLTKAEVRRRAEALGLRTASKPDSQEVCFIPSPRGGGRAAFLGARIPLRPGVLVDRAGAEVGGVPAVQLVTVGQRRGLGAGPDGTRRFALAVDPAAGSVVVGDEQELRTATTVLTDVSWVDGGASGAVLAQTSAHGEPRPATFDPATGAVTWREPHRRVAPGQSVVLYDGDDVLGGGIAA